MKGNPVLYKALVIGVIVLFIGVGIQPAIALNEYTSISDDEDDCNLCPKVSKQHIVRIKGLIDRLEFVNNFILSKFGDKPEIKKKCEDLSLNITKLNKIINLQTPYSWFPGMILICIILGIIEEVAWSIAFIFVIPIAIFENYYMLWNIMRILFGLPMIFFVETASGIYYLRKDLGCIPPDH